MLQIKNTLGGGKPEGLYVWKKYYYEPEITVTNPQFTMSGGAYVYSIYSITNANFDLTLLPSMGGYSENSSSTPSELTRVSGQVADFFDGFKYDSSTYFYLSGTSLNLSAGSKANAMYNFNAIDSSNGWIAGQYTGTGCGSVNNTFKYTGTKVIKPEIKDFIGYIVSDKETAYPNGGEKGGYWYEKVSDISKTDKIIFDTANQLIPDNVKAMSLVHTEEITPASDSSTLNHSYGKIPYQFIVTTEDFENAGTQYKIINITYKVIGNVVLRKHVRNGGNNILEASSYIQIADTYISNTQSAFRFIAGHTYKLYVFE